MSYAGKNLFNGRTTVVENPTMGEVLWTILPTDEAVNDGPRWRRPWKGKVKDIRGVFGVVLLCSFNPETGELDLDSNASASLGFDHLYRTEQAAWEAYDKVLDGEMLGLAQEKEVARKALAPDA